MSPENVGLGSAPAPAVQTAAVPGGPSAMRPPEYYGSAAHRVITETPRDYPRNVRECCAPRGPKSPVERCMRATVFKTAVSHLVGRQRSTLLQTGGESRPELNHLL